MNTKAPIRPNRLAALEYSVLGPANAVKLWVGGIDRSSAMGVKSLKGEATRRQTLALTKAELRRLDLLELD